MTLKHEIKQLALRMGVELRRFNPLESPDARLLHQLQVHNIDLVIDVGANDGGYGRFLRGGGYTGRILSFEPLSKAHAALVAAVADDAKWFVAPRMALGESDGETKINIAGNSTSSSVLPMGELHQAAAPSSVYQGSESVMLRRLDSIEHEAISGAQSILLKIDTQGYEMPVLRGARQLLARATGVQLELSVVALYEGQSTYRDVIPWLSDEGFELWNVLPGFADPKSGRMLQFDGVFFKPNNY